MHARTRTDADHAADPAQERDPASDLMRPWPLERAAKTSSGPASDGDPPDALSDLPEGRCAVGALGSSLSERATS